MATDRYERIREALDMGPTPGPWDGDGYSVSRLWSNGTVGIREYIALPDSTDDHDPNPADMHFIAACDPDTLRALLEERDVLRDEVERLRARVAEMERDMDACRVELLEARRAVGEEWFADGEATLAEGVARKCRMLEDDAEHWRRSAEARSLRAEDGDHALHRFAALAAAKNEGRSAITLTVWSDGTVDAEQYATLDGELDEWGTLYQERRASWGSRPIGELDALVADLESGDWYTVEHRAPQDFWGEIAVLRDEVERLRDDIEMACENTPWPGCECPGCEAARERAEAELKGGSDG